MLALHQTTFQAIIYDLIKTLQGHYLHKTKDNIEHGWFLSESEDVKKTDLRQLC